MTGRLLLDVNALAILAVDDHPGHRYVAEVVADGLRGEDTLLVSDYLPLRVQWVLTDKWGIDHVAARNAVQSLLRQPLEIVSGTRETLLHAYEISADENHPVFDCYYVALAAATDADGILTTDADFSSLCEGREVSYVNPVPDDVRAAFHDVNE